MTNINTPNYWNEVYEHEWNNNMIHMRDDIYRWNILINKIQPKKKVLEYGCGFGSFLKYLKQARSDTKLTGVDFSDFAISKAKKLVPNVDFDTDISIFKNGCFDIIIVQHVLEHKDNPNKFLEELKLMLKPTGVLIIVVPIEDNEWKEHVFRWSMVDFVMLCNKTDYYLADFIHRPYARVNTDTKEYLQEGIAIMAYVREKDAP